MPDKTIRLDLDLYQQVAKVAERADRTPRKQIERWLREALEKLPKSPLPIRTYPCLSDTQCQINYPWLKPFSITL